MSDTTMLIAAAQGDAKVFKTRAEAAEAERDRWVKRANAWAKTNSDLIDQRDRLQARVAELESGCVDDLRQRGWAVAAHNDYQQDGKACTFWLLTRGSIAIKGEGLSNAAALNQIRAALQQEPNDGK